MENSRVLSSHHQYYICSRSVAYVSSASLIVIVGPTTTGVLVGRTGPKLGWLQGPATCDGCGFTGEWIRLPQWVGDTRLGRPTGG